MSRLLLIIIALLIPTQAYAVENPFKVPNNKIGIHILFDHELKEASSFVNSNGGDWGYVTIPIQNIERDLIKWQTFMDLCKKLHVIPIIRLASEGDYFNTQVWKKPTPSDIVDFANFLDSLSWPTKNRYVIVYNEVNRADEWGGAVDPKDYANILSFAVNVFKSKSDDFFIISAGLDNAAPDQYPNFMNQYAYYREMQMSVPGIFNQIDGFASHSYPNPGFSQSPKVLTNKSTISFKYEKDLIRKYRNKDIPVFITETGWNHDSLSDETKALYYKEAFASTWADPGIVAITPFLLNAGDGPFKGFTFLNSDGKPTLQMESILKMPKVKGKPVIAPLILGIDKQSNSKYPVRYFTDSNLPNDNFSLSLLAQDAFKWIMRL